MSSQIYQSKHWKEITNVTVDGSHIRILSIIRDRAKTVIEIAEELGATPMEVRTWLAELENWGLLQGAVDENSASESSRFVPEARVAELNNALVAVVGPLAGVIMSDVLKNLGMAADRIPIAAEDELVASLASELPASTKSGFLSRVTS